MKIFNMKKKIGFVLLVTGFLMGPAFQAMGHEKKDAEGKSTLSIPATLPGIWAKVQGEHKELDETIVSGKLSKVHEIAFAIRDYVAAMPALSSKLPSAKLKSLKFEMKIVSRLASQLDEAGDSGDTAKTKALGKRMHVELGKIKNLYPEGLLSSVSEPGAGATK